MTFYIFVSAYSHIQMLEYSSLSIFQLRDVEKFRVKLCFFGDGFLTFSVLAFRFLSEPGEAFALDDFSGKN